MRLQKELHEIEINEIPSTLPMLISRNSCCGATQYLGGGALRPSCDMVGKGCGGWGWGAAGPMLFGGRQVKHSERSGSMYSTENERRESGVNEVLFTVLVEP